MRADEQSVIDTVQTLLNVISTGNVEAYARMVADDVSCFEHDAPPYRIDGVEFHLNMMKERKGRSRVTRIDVLAPRVQRFGNIAIATYTVLKTVLDDDDDLSFDTANETRVFERREGDWIMVHFHRSAGQETLV